MTEGTFPKRVDLDLLKVEEQEQRLARVAWFVPTQLPKLVSVLSPLDSAVVVKRIRLADGTKVKVPNGFELSRSHKAMLTRIGARYSETYGLAVEVDNEGVRVWTMFLPQLLSLNEMSDVLQSELFVSIKDGSMSVEPVPGSIARMKNAKDGARALHLLETLEREHDAQAVYDVLGGSIE